ncbi:MAG TPA: hypothetical protein VMM12_11875, partial [Longimicrobiales bacterium]|nr:hypothetical protein [Longimicrobiales bacterium]
MTFRILPALLLAAVALLAAPPAAAQSYDPPSVRAVQLGEGEEIELDGLLDEAAWARAPAASGFRQREPAVGEPATQPTEVRVVYDGTTLYV